MKTARELADLFQEQRRRNQPQSSQIEAIVASNDLSPEDHAAVRRLVAAEGMHGIDQEEMVRKVTALIIGQVEAMADDQPAEGGD